MAHNTDTDSNYNTDIDYNSDSEYEGSLDSGFEEYVSDTFYGPEEQSLTKFNLVMCEIYNTNLHGDLLDIHLHSHYLVKIRYREFDIELLRFDCAYENRKYRENFDFATRKRHKIIRNYANIISRPNYIKPEIVECIYLVDGLCIGILKTMWLRLIQRTWKNIYKKQNETIRNRCSFKSLVYREIHGTWPSNCRSIPTLKGMLSYLK